MIIEDNKFIIDEIVSDMKINIDYEIQVEYKNNIFKIYFGEYYEWLKDIINRMLEENQKELLKEIIIDRALEDYGGIMEELYELDKAES